MYAMTDDQSKNNVTDLSVLKGKTLVHHKSGDLPYELAAMLVLATKYGAYVEPLVSYLDRRFGRTEVELLHTAATSCT